MKRRAILVAAASAFLAGCSGSWQVEYDEGVDPNVSKLWHVHNIRVVVPADLTVSNRNTYAPDADIVWHGDLESGSRRKQVATILTEGIEKAAGNLDGPRPVEIQARLEHFHAVTPAAVSRAPAAVHNIAYTIQIIDDETGMALTAPQYIQADLEAYVGASAITAAIQGQTQRVRITDHIASVTSGWLGVGPDPRRAFQSVGR